MTTEDISVPFDGSWLGVPLTTTQTLIFNPNADPFYVRMGASSSSIGFLLHGGKTAIADETVYLKATNASQIVVVTR